MNLAPKILTTPLLSALCATALVATVCTGTARAQESNEPETAAPDLSKWTCSRCPDPVGWEGSIFFGLGWISDPSLRYGNYRGLEDDGAYFPLDLNGIYQDAEGRHARFWGENLGLDSRQLEAEGGRYGRYELRFAWKEIPTYRGYGAQTPFLGQRTDTLLLPADWVTARTTEQMPTLQQSLQPAPLKLQRKTIDIGASFRIASNWSIDVDAQRQDKSGTRPFGGAGVFYNDASQLTAPVDFTTDRLDVGLNWGNQTVQFRLGFMGSWFDNDNTSLTWQNPFNAPEELGRYQAALEPSNHAYHVNLTGAWTIAPGIHLSGYGSIGKMKQDEAFLPYSINPEFADLLLPRATLDGKVDTSVANLGGKFFARINSRLSVTATARYNDRDNKTPVDLYTPVTSDYLLLGDRVNRPYSFKRQRYDANVRFRAFRKLRLGAGAEYQKLERTLQAVEDSDQTTWWGEAKFTPVARSHIRLLYEYSDRDISEYQQITDSGRHDHPLFRKFNQADRTRERGLVEAFYSTEGGLGINLSLYSAKDDYDESVLGLQKSKTRGGTLSLDYAISLRTSVYAFGSRDKIESELFGADGNVGWFGDTDDKISTIGAGFSTSFESDRKLGIDFIWADTDGDINVTSGGQPPFPTLTTTLTNVRLHFSDMVNENWGYRLWVEYEDFDSSDWAFDGIGVDGVPNVLTYGIISPNYSVWNLSAQATYRF